MKKITAVLFGAAVVVAVGCSAAGAAIASSSSEESDDFIRSSDELVAAYLDEAEVLEADLPTDISFPEDSPYLVLPKGAVAESGVADAFANFYWLCSWEKSYLDGVHAGDVTVQADALDHIAQWPSQPFTKEHVVDPDGLWNTTVLEPALAGDPSAVAAEFESSCGAFTEANPE